VSFEYKRATGFISKKYGAQYHPLYIYRLLRRLEQSLITPRKRHYKANPRSGWAFKGHIKKDRQWRSEGYIIFAEDEAIISVNPNCRKLWAPKGSKPIMLVNGSHKNVCFFGVVSDEGNHCCTREWINEDSFIWFLKYIKKHHEKFVMLADRATHHFKSKKSWIL